LAPRLSPGVFLRFLRRLFLEIPLLVLWPAFFFGRRAKHDWVGLGCDGGGLFSESFFLAKQCDCLKQTLQKQHSEECLANFK